MLWGRLASYGKQIVVYDLGWDGVLYFGFEFQVVGRVGFVIFYRIRIWIWRFGRFLLWVMHFSAIIFGSLIIYRVCYAL